MNENRDIDRARFEGEVTAKLDGIDTKLNSLVESMTVMDSRVRTLENFQYKILGISVVLAALAGWLTQGL